MPLDQARTHDLFPLSPGVAAAFENVLAAAQLLDGRFAYAIARLHCLLDRPFAPALAARDRAFLTHAASVACYAELLARALGWDAARREQVCLAAWLQDLGLLGLPDHILQRPGPLSDEQAVVVMGHPEVSALLLSLVPWLSDLLPLVRHHHERYDGAGYPAGLAGQAIPEGARVLAIADAFAAMTSDRPYRPALDVHAALQRLRDSAGSQFDPMLIECFVPALLAEFAAGRLHASHALIRAGTASGQPPRPYQPLRVACPRRARSGRLLAAILERADPGWDVQTLLEHVATLLRNELPACQVQAWVAPGGRRIASSLWNGATLCTFADSRLPGRAWLPLADGDDLIAYLEVAHRWGEAIPQDDWDTLSHLIPQLGALLATASAARSGQVPTGQPSEDQ